MKTLDLSALEKEINNFITERDWDQFHSTKNLAMALSVESSELLEIFQWMSEADSNVIGNNPKLKSKLADEVADVFVYLFRIANRADIDLESAIYQKMKKNREKYPVELSRGNSKKYNEL